MERQENRLLNADRIHDGNGWLPEGAVVEVKTDGTIAGIHDTTIAGVTEHFTGILVPGFINAHCHLELSHMKGIVPERTGLIPFLQAIPAQRNKFSEEQKKAARQAAYQELIDHGTVAVGDIANSPETLDIRAQGLLHMHTFVECIGFSEQFAQARLNYSLEVLAVFNAQEAKDNVLRQSVIPHAPYSVSAALFRLINEAAPDSLISIHNQESPAEDEFYQLKTGKVLDLLAGLGIDAGFFTPSGKSSLQTYLPAFSPSHPMLLVHNTYTPQADVLYAESIFQRLSWCLCPNANLYIEHTLPDVPMLQRHTGNICIGTDSLASNHRLSVFDELCTLKTNFPGLEWEELIRWGTLNGAKALQLDTITGSLETGKKPGLVLLSALDRTATVRRVL